MRQKRRTTKDATTTPLIGTSYKVDGKTYTFRVSKEEGEHAMKWLAQRGRPTWSELLREAHAHATKALGIEAHGAVVREVALVMMRYPVAMRRLAVLIKAVPGSKRERAEPKAKKHVEANA